MKNIKKILNTNILANQMNSSLFFILQMKLKNKNEKSANSYSLSQYTFKNSSYFKLLKTLELKFPLQLTTFANPISFNTKTIDFSNTVLLKIKHFVFIDKNLVLFELKNEKMCMNKIAFCFQGTLFALNGLLGSKPSFN
jgi:hypothetical protein